MRHRKIFAPPGSASPKRQIADMVANFPGFKWKANRKGGLVWKGVFQPTSDSPEYHVRVCHDPGFAPRVYVDSPVLPKDAPHRYPDGNLCLYWPDEWRWTPRESIAKTLLPWTALWLYYYEIWLFCGKWLGPSSPHGLPKAQPDEDMLVENENRSPSTTP